MFLRNVCVNLVITTFQSPQDNNLNTRTLHSVEFIISTPHQSQVNQSRRVRWAGYVARMVDRRGAYRDLVGKPEGTRPLRIHRRR
jgi:hypothetical protein